jgi:hypothetical protein
MGLVIPNDTRRGAAVFFFLRHPNSPQLPASSSGQARPVQLPWQRSSAIGPMCLCEASGQAISRGSQWPLNGRRRLPCHGPNKTWTGCHPVSDQALRAVPLVLEFAAFALAASHGLRGGDAFQRLDAGHIVDADRVGAICGLSLRGFQGRVTHGLDSLLELRIGLLVWRVELVPRAMRLQVARHSKNARRGGRKSKGRCLVGSLPRSVLWESSA